MVVRLPRLHSGQLRALSSLRRFAVIVAGRRWGKTRLASTISIERALRGKRVWWVAPVYDLARAGWDDITFLASQIPGITLRKADRAISFPGGGEIWVRSADRPHNLRAFGIDLLVLDEAAFLRHDTWNTVLRPSLADRGGSAIMISTPAGKNWFYEVAMRAKEGKLPDWSFYTAPTWDNPLIPDAEIKEMEMTMPRRSFLQEIAAQFLDQEGPSGPTTGSSGFPSLQSWSGSLSVSTPPSPPRAGRRGLWWRASARTASTMSSLTRA